MTSAGLTSGFLTGDFGGSGAAVSGLQNEILFGRLCSSTGLVSRITASEGDLRSLTTLRLEVTVKEVNDGLTGSEAEAEDGLWGVIDGLGLVLVGKGGAEDTTRPLLPDEAI